VERAPGERREEGAVLVGAHLHSRRAQHERRDEDTLVVRTLHLGALTITFVVRIEAKRIDDGPLFHHHIHWVTTREQYMIPVGSLETDMLKGSANHREFVVFDVLGFYPEPSVKVQRKQIGHPQMYKTLSELIPSIKLIEPPEIQNFNFKFPYWYRMTINNLWRMNYPMSSNLR